MFLIESREAIALCPACGKPLKYHGRALRRLTNIRGHQDKYSIRVLKCVNTECETTYHRELPNIMIPYKRFGTESIEEAIERGNSEITVAADQATIWRWRKWFKTNANNIIGALKSAVASIDSGDEAPLLANKKQDSQEPIEAIRKILNLKKEWLGETACVLVNYSMWPFNRSAFLSG